MREKTTLKKLLFNHNNDYGFDVIRILPMQPKSVPNLSVVIPYFETKSIIKLTLRHLYNSLDTVQGLYKDWKFEVIVVDDGSKKFLAEKQIKVSKYTNLKIISSPYNKGRSSTRNIGLYNSRYELCLFMDSDILVDTQLILNHLKIHSYCQKIKKIGAITISFFQFSDEKEPLLKFNRLTPVDLKLNDYRLYCKYGPTWIGCEEDKKFVGKEFRIVQDTKDFRDWRGMYKAWALTNMVLGGFFMVDRRESIKVNGFNESFKGYGFTETSLPTKLIVTTGNFLIPILIGSGLHIEDKKVNISRKNKDRIFWEKHDFYFNKYLELTPKNAIEDKI